MVNNKREIELLAPARNLQNGIEAILHGADAIYIGIDKFSARSAAGNSISDIAKLVDFAHKYYAKVYVALNTIIYNDELAEVENVIYSLYKENVDAIIIQDMGILQLDLPPIALHASTQTDNRTIEKIIFLEKSGFSRVVLARELTINEINSIASKVSIPLEVFVHGSLCVSYSGQCYVSHALTGRSANRGECAQICRQPFDLTDSKGNIIKKKSHLLSLKDLCQINHLEEIIDAGASSLKIEGRLKELSYVKNITAAYRNKLDSIFDKRPEFIRSSSGKSEILFEPDVAKSFNRGFSNLFLYGQNNNICSNETPKSMGEKIGYVKQTVGNAIIINSKSKINNGDGLCFFDSENLTGFRVNKIENNNIIFTLRKQNVKTGTVIYRNLDYDFENKLSKPTAIRKITAEITINDTEKGFILLIRDENNNKSSLNVNYEKQVAINTQYNNIIKQLKKTGNSIFEINNVSICFSNDWFINTSILNNWRNTLIQNLINERLNNYSFIRRAFFKTNHNYYEKKISYLGNISNEMSKYFYFQHNVNQVYNAFEIDAIQNKPLMFMKHCIKFTLGICPKKNKANTNVISEPLYLVYKNTTLKLNFDCVNCLTTLTIAEQ